MNYVARGAKKPVNMTLSEDLVREARLLTRNLSETVERLLCSFVESGAETARGQVASHRCNGSRVERTR